MTYGSTSFSSLDVIRQRLGTYGDTWLFDKNHVARQISHPLPTNDLLQKLDITRYQQLFCRAYTS